MRPLMHPPGTVSSPLSPSPPAKRHPVAAGPTRNRLRHSAPPLCGGLLICCCAIGAHAQDASPPATTPTAAAPVSEELELLKEEETVSIATRHEQPISQAPSNVYVITDEDIRHSGATDIPTILRRVPGLDVMQVTGADFNVSARGDNQLFANKILVMVDGRSIYIDGQGLVFWKSLPVTLPEIKRIEVLKGPASVVYGFNAFDGVINIITKSAQDMKGTTLQFGGGELGTISSSAVQAGSAGKLDYRLSIGHDQNQQWRNHDALAFRSNKFNVQTQYNFSGDATLRVAGGFIDTNRFDGPVSNVQIPRSQFNQGYTDVHYQYRNFSVRGWWQGNDIPVDSATHPLLSQFVRQANATDGSNVSFTTNTYNIEAQHSLEFGLGQPAELWRQLSLQHSRRQCRLRIRARRSSRGPSPGRVEDTSISHPRGRSPLRPAHKNQRHLESACRPRLQPNAGAYISRQRICRLPPPDPIRIES
jgi:outer membrane cobalamin receptor